MRYLVWLIVLSSGLLSHAATINAASCSQSDVQKAINSASAGDTVVVPAGTCTYTTTASYTPSVTINKAVTVQGQTTCTGRAASLSCTDNTIIYDGTGTNSGEIPISMTSDNARLTGFTFLDKRSVVDYKYPLQVSGAGWRIDHCHFAPTNTAYPSHGIYAYGNGLVDHSYFKDVNGGVDVDGSNSKDATYPGDYNWTQSLDPGGANAVYIEDNEFAYSAGNVLDGATDSYAGARLVFRYNDVQNTNWGGHGLDSGGLRSVLLMEIYNNTASNSGTHIYTLIGSRGGTFYIFNNTTSASGGSFDSFMWLQNYRSDSAYQSNWGPCDGSNSIDQNKSGQQGSVCQDQVGRAGPQSGFGTLETYYPGYSWGNNFKGSAPTISNVTICGYQDCTRAQTYHILNNRDFYMEVPSFNGTAGTGTGLLSARPSTCTPQVAYWATDTNTLYQCSSSNTWKSYYTPYQYPHPLQGPGQGPLPPQGLGASVQ